MLLYHFTSFGHIPSILASGGLQKGDVMVGENGEQTLTATWLTTDPNPAVCLGLSTGGLFETPMEIARQIDGKPWRETVDKTKARITVKIPSTDRNLKHWVTWAKGRVGETLYNWDIKVSGGKENASKNYFYAPLIPVKEFLKIELYMDASRDYREATPGMLDGLIQHDVGWVGRSPLAPRDN